MKSLFRNYFAFLHREIKYICFIILFISSYAAYEFVAHANLALSSIPEGMIGIATLHGIDVEKRVRIFYGAVYLFSGSLFLLSFLLLPLQKYLHRTEFRLINQLSLGGLALLISAVFFKNNFDPVNLIFIFIGNAFLCFLLNFFFFKAESRFHESFLASLLIAWWIYFFISDFISALFPSVSLSLYACLLAFTLPVYILFQLKNPARAQKKLVDLSSFAWLPVLGFLSTEFYLILNQHRIFILSPSIWYAIGLLLLIFIARIRSKKPKSARSAEKVIGTCWVPLLIAGIILHAFYHPVININANLYDFENGNKALPLAELFRFGNIPLIGKNNSHLLSDWGFGLIYDVLNGYDGLGFTIYNVLYVVSALLITYYFVLEFTRSLWTAFFIVILSPLSDKVLNDYFTYVLIMILAMKMVMDENGSKRSWRWFFAGFIFIILWRVDLGYSILFATAGMLLFFAIKKKPGRILWSNSWKSLLETGIPISIFFLGLALWKGINIPEYIFNTLHFYSSDQTFGYDTLGNSPRAQFAAQFYVMPLLVALLLIYLFVFHFKLTRNRRQVFNCCALIFLSVFYFANAQRGLVRHSFVENYDAFIASYSFFIISAGVYLLLWKKSQEIKFTAYSALSIFLVAGFSFPPDQSYTGYFSEFLKAGKTAIAPSNEKITRTSINLQPVEKDAGLLIQFLKKHLQPNQTFIDFTNTPMLYYYAEKPLPSYFFQIPLSVHDTYLQQTFLKNLKTCDAPVLIFSHRPRQWGNDVDGVPNEVRHFTMAEYFYQQYHPAFLINGFSVWLRNDFQVSDSAMADETWRTPQSMDIGQLPLLWANDPNIKSRAVVNSVQTVLGDSVTIPIDSNLNKITGNFLWINISNLSASDINVEVDFGNKSTNGSYTFTGRSGEHNYAIRLSMQYLWFRQKAGWIKLKLKNGDGSVRVRNIQLISG